MLVKSRVKRRTLVLIDTRTPHDLFKEVRVIRRAMIPGMILGELDGERVYLSLRRMSDPDIENLRLFVGEVSA